MSQRKKTSSSIRKKSASERLTGKKDISSTLRIKDYSLSGFEHLSNLSFYQNICLMIAAAMVTIVILVQLRCLRPDAASSKMDQLPSYRFYKKRILTSDAGLSTAFIIASSQDDAVVHLPEDPVSLENTLISNMDCYQGNEPFIEKCSSANYMDYICGHTSRIVGLMTSCCSANMGVFGLMSDCTSWSVADVLANIPFADISNISPSVVIAYLRSVCLTPGTGGSPSSIVFQETPFEGGDSVNGGCKLEFEIFGNDMPSRVAVSKNSSASNVSVATTLTDDQLKAGLSPIEYRKFQSAKQLGRNDLIKKFVDIVTAKLAKATATNEQASAVKTSESAVPSDSPSNDSSMNAEPSGSSSPVKPPKAAPSSSVTSTVVVDAPSASTSAKTAFSPVVTGKGAANVSSAPDSAKKSPLTEAPGQKEASAPPALASAKVLTPKQGRAPLGKSTDPAQPLTSAKTTLPIPPPKVQGSQGSNEPAGPSL